MAQYRTGVVSLQHGSQTVVGSNTKWNTTSVQLHYLFMIRGEQNIYEIQTFYNSNLLTLQTPYYNNQNADVINKQYLIVQDYTPYLMLPKINKGDWNWPQLIRRAEIRIDLFIKMMGGYSFFRPLTGIPISHLRFEVVPSGVFYNTEGGGTVYVPHSSVKSIAGKVIYDEYFDSLLVCKGELGSATLEDGRTLYYTKWYRVKRDGYT